MKQLRAVFFDAAGTLFHTREPVGLSYARLAGEYGVEATAEQVDAGFRRAFHNAGGLAFGPGHSAEALRRLEREWWRGVVADTFVGAGRFSDFEGYFAALFSFFADPLNWRADSDAAAVLENLQRRELVLGVISNFDFRLYRILSGLGLSRYFNSITISSEAGYAKPSPEIFGAALRRHSLQPEQALHVGDSRHLDVVGATGAGLAAALIDAQLGAPARIEDGTAHIARLSVLPELLGEFPFP